jgi:hypothetical protein
METARCCVVSPPGSPAAHRATAELRLNRFGIAHLLEGWSAPALRQKALEIHLCLKHARRGADG